MNRQTSAILAAVIVLCAVAVALLVIGDEDTDGVAPVASAPGDTDTPPPTMQTGDVIALVGGEEADGEPAASTRRLHGRVLDEGERPVTGAEITVRRYGLDPVVVTSGPDGGFEAVVGDSLPLHAAAEAEGFVRGTAMVRAHGQDVEIVLRRGRQVSGVVLSAEGQPVPGATVRAGHHETVARDGGVFVLEGLPPGPAAVEARRHMARSDPERVDLSLGPVHGLTLRLKPAGSLEVRVRTDGGEPVAGASVTVEPHGWGESYDVTTGEDGDVLVEPLPTGSARVTAVAPGRAAAEETAEIPSDGEGTVTLRLVEAHALVVHTRLDRGAPRPGEPVTLRLVPAAGVLDRDVHLHQLSAGIGEPAVFESVAAGEWRVVVHHPVYSADPVAATVPGPDVTLVLEDGGSVSGRVIDDENAPVAGAFVLASPILDPTADRTELRPARNARTDADGRFEIDGLAHGQWRLVPRMSGFVGAESAVARPGDRNITLRLVQARSIEGQVVNGRGVPEEGLRVVARAAEGDRRRVARGVSQADGSFVIGGLEPGRYEVWAERSQRRTDTATATAGGTPVQLVLPVGATVRGRVVGPGGRVPEQYTVLGFSYRDPSGAFELTELDPRVDAIWFESPGLLRTEVAVALQDDRVTDLGVVEIPAPARLSGRVETEDGRAVSGATVVLEVQENGSAHPAIAASDEDGHFDFSGLRLGRARVQAIFSDGTSNPAETTLRSGETATLRLIVPSP